MEEEDRNGTSTCESAKRMSNTLIMMLAPKHGMMERICGMTDGGDDADGQDARGDVGAEGENRTKSTTEEEI